VEGCRTKCETDSAGSPNCSLGDYGGFLVAARIITGDASVTVLDEGHTVAWGRIYLLKREQ